MGEIHHVGKIQVHEDERFLTIEPRMQRLGWSCMALLLLLGLAGALGRGPIASSRIGDDAVFSVSYDAITRHSSDTHLTIRVGPGLQPDSVLRLYLSHSYIASFKLIDTYPHFVSSGASGDFVYFDFLRANSRAPIEIDFHLEPVGYWSRSVVVGLAGVTRLEFSQFILP